jgi:hypothetical protein
VTSAAPAVACIAFAVLGAGCARTVVFACGIYKPVDRRPGHVEVLAGSELGFELEMIEVNGPGFTREWRQCSAPHYPQVSEDATQVELKPGAYLLTAKAARIASPPMAFPVRGQVTIEPGACYVPAMACDGKAPEAGACRLVLTPTACQRPWFPRRIDVKGVSAC